MSKKESQQQQIHKPLCPCGRKLLLVKEAASGGPDPGGRMGDDGQQWWHRGMQGSPSPGKQHSHFLSWSHSSF